MSKSNCLDWLLANVPEVTAGDGEGLSYWSWYFNFSSFWSRFELYTFKI